MPMNFYHTTTMFSESVCVSHYNFSITWFNFINLGTNVMSLDMIWTPHISQCQHLRPLAGGALSLADTRWWRLQEEVWNGSVTCTVREWEEYKHFRGVLKRRDPENRRSLTSLVNRTRWSIYLCMCNISCTAAIFSAFADNVLDSSSLLSVPIFTVVSHTRRY